MRHSTAKFTWSKDTQTFVAEISDLSDDVFGQIYPDACDLGIILVSEKTGAESKWFIDSKLRNDDGELTGWRLLPTPEARRNFPALKQCEVIILND